MADRASCSTLPVDTKANLVTGTKIPRRIRVDTKILARPLAVFSLLLFSLTATSQDKLAATPPMGWNSWNHFAERVDDATVRATADALVSTGLPDAGYVYLNLTHTCEGARNAHG